MTESKHKAAGPAGADARIVNGIDIETLMATVKALKADPELGACHFRASNTWLGATRNRSTVAGFYAAKQEIAHTRRFQMDADEPAIVAGTDEAANPVEHLLHALAACVTTSMVAHAAVRGIPVEEAESELEGNIDLRGFLGIADDVPRGYTDIRMKLKVKADPKDMRRLEELCKYSPVSNTISNGARVHIQVEPK